MPECLGVFTIKYQLDVGTLSCLFLIKQRPMSSHFNSVFIGRTTKNIKFKSDLSSLENPAPALEKNLTTHPRPQLYLSSGPPEPGS